MRVPFSRAFSRASITVLALSATALAAFADDYQCTSSAGCDAIVSTDNGTKKVKFRKGDIVSTAHGWVVNPNDGWIRVD